MVKFANVKDGDVLIADGGFTCINAGRVTVKRSDRGLYFDCRDGKHYLDGQENEVGELVGLSR